MLNIRKLLYTSFIITSSLLTSLKFRASAIFTAKYGSIPLNKELFFKNASYFSRFLHAASLTILLKQALSSANNVQSVFALIEAALGAL